ncbi:hypothetical protein [Propionibacterium freudenreichii]|uniref:hypothetical protein n=1 Tax=Propionibacterium freudenreichii TaxID=1744 RepID=UPI003855228B
MNLARTSTPRRAPVKDPAGHTLATLKTLVKRATTRGVTANRCRRCHAPILTGVDADECGWHRAVDWTPLDQNGELLALLAGRPTFTITLQPAGNPKLTKRTAIAIKRGPGVALHDIVPEHRCHATLPTTPSQLTTKPATRRNDPPPF